LGLLAAWSPLKSSTVVRLSLDEMIVKSTEIVRGRIVSSRTSMRGPVVYTTVQVEVEERWKGSRADLVDVAIPGGQYGAILQTFSGTPQLESDTDYVLFLWTGSSGMTQVIGLSQGVLEVKRTDAGELVVERSASEAVMMDAAGNQVKDQSVSMPLQELRGRIERMMVVRGR
jgi:hypothetical protein